MSDLELQIVHRRMMKVKLEARASDYSAASPASTTTATPTTSGNVQVTVTATSTSVPVVPTIPISTAAIAAIAGALGLTLILVTVGCFWRRSKLRSRKKRAPSTLVDFNPDAFAAEKKPYGLQGHVRADFTSIGLQSPTPTHKSSPVTPSESEESTYTGWKPQVPANFRITNDSAEKDTYLPAVPKAVAEKRRPSQRAIKPTWISTDPEDLARSPPPSYDLANNSGHGFAFSSLTEVQGQGAASTSTPHTAPAAPKSYYTSSKKAAAPMQVLVVPTNDEYPPIPSPARSESFAPKDLMIVPTPPASAPVVASSSKSSPPVSSSSSHGFGHNGSGGGSSSKTPRMMTVIAPYTPTLADELHVAVGDTVRLLQEYRDGWCFAQYVGKADAPKGVVPLVCLQERRRMVPSMGHKGANGSNASLTSLNANWRG